MGFFDVPEDEPDDDGEEVEESDTAPWIPGVVPMELLAARSERGAVMVGGIHAYPVGFEISVTGHFRRPLARARRPSRQNPWPTADLHCGLVWPDGGRATDVDGYGTSAVDRPRAACALEPRSSHGSSRSQGTTYWAWPVPAGGPLVVVVEWRSTGIPETSTTIDGDLIADAAARARPVLEEDPQRPFWQPRADPYQAP